MDAALSELLGTPPAEFVATRNRLVAELKAAGDAEGARRLAKLRRPSLVDWALNVVAAEQPDLADEWVAAAEAATAAQSSGSAELRSRLSELRAVTNDLVKAVGRRAPAGDVAQALARVAADPALVDAFRRGTLGFALDGGLVTAADVAARGSARPSRPDRSAARVRDLAEAAVARAERELADAEAAHAEAEADLARAADVLEEARRAAQQAEREHLAAQRRLAAAHRLVVEANDAVRQARRRLADG